MDDKELLEMAARVGGYAVDRWVYDDIGGVMVAVLDTGKYWQPLHENTLTDCMGDALRLAVKLVIDVRPPRTEDDDALARQLSLNVQVCEPQARNAMEAIRRAIVRAAAKIGKTMSTKPE